MTLRSFEQPEFRTIEIPIVGANFGVPDFSIIRSWAVYRYDGHQYHKVGEVAKRSDVSFVTCNNAGVTCHIKARSAIRAIEAVQSLWDFISF